jgi:hypothetical protein
MVLPWIHTKKLYCFALDDYPLLQLLLWHKLLDIILPIISFVLVLIVVISLCTKSESRFFKSQLSYLSIPSFSLTWLTGVLFLTFDIDRSISTILYQHPRTSRIEDWLLPFKQSIYLIFTLIGRYQQFIINIRELNVLNNDYLLCSFLVTSQSSHLESWGSHFSLPKVLILNL